MQPFLMHTDLIFDLQNDRNTYILFRPGIEGGSKGIMNVGATMA